eukprot:12417715-Prorocentrum_lima.AAC.1
MAVLKHSRRLTSPQLLNAPIDEIKVILVAVPQMLTKLGLMKPGTAWEIRKAVYGLKASPRLWQEERER